MRNLEKPESKEKPSLLMTAFVLILLVGITLLIILSYIRTHRDLPSPDSNGFSTPQDSDGGTLNHPDEVGMSVGSFPVEMGTSLTAGSTTENFPTVSRRPSVSTVGTTRKPTTKRPAEQTTKRTAKRTTKHTSNRTTNPTTDRTTKRTATASQTVGTSAKPPLTEEILHAVRREIEEKYAKEIEDRKERNEHILAEVELQRQEILDQRNWKIQEVNQYYFKAGQTGTEQHQAALQKAMFYRQDEYESLGHVKEQEEQEYILWKQEMERTIDREVEEYLSEHYTR